MIFLVMDGLGGMEVPEKGGSELQVARAQPDALAAGACVGSLIQWHRDHPERPWPFRDFRLSSSGLQHRPRYPVGVWHRFPTHPA
jgi:hypothetical protein